MTAVYLTIGNRGGDDRLVGATTDVARRVSAMGPGVAMPAGGATPSGSALDVAVPSGATELAPGGTHVMLEQLTRPLVAGERVTVRIEFATAGPLDVPVDVVDWDEVVERTERASER